MSALVLLAEHAQHLPVITHTLTAGAQAGILDQTNNLASEAMGTLKSIGGVAATAVALIAGWRARGAVAGMAIGLLVAFVWFWGMSNVGNAEITNRINEDLVGSLGQPVSTAAPGGSEDVAASRR